MSVPANVLDCLAVERSDDGVTWTRLGPLSSLGALLRTRRFSAGPGRTVMARHWRVVKVGGADMGGARVSLDRIAFYREDPAAPSAEAVRLWPFNFDDTSQRYILAATAGNVEVYHQGARVASIRSPFFDEVATVHTAQSLDTLIACHPDVPPTRFMRQGAHGEWDVRSLQIDHVPLYDYDGTRAGGVDEVQQISFQDYVAGDVFNVTFEGETTAQIIYAGDNATTAERIQAALAELGGIGDGGVSVAAAGGATFNVSFVGDNRASDVGQLAPVTLHSTKGGASGGTLTQGRAGGEPVISDARGWPAASAFYQQRLWFGGLRSRPHTILGSVLGGYFDFRTKTGLDQAAIDVTLDVTTEIRSLFPGRHLQVFGSAAEFYFPLEPITAKTSAVKQTTNRGVQPGTPQVLMDGGTLFICAGGDALASFVFDFSVESYTAQHISVLASHLVQGVVDMGFRQARNTSESDLAIMVRADGAAAVMVALRDQDVTGFVPWSTDGRFLSCACELRGDLYAAVARTVDGADRVTLERFDAGRMLDASVAGGAAGVTLAGLEHLEGRTVALYIDGADAGDAAVHGGAVTLPYAPVRSVEAGLLYQPEGALLPIVLQQDQRGGLSMRPRSGEVLFRLGPTANLQAGLVGGKLFRVSMKHRPGALLDQGPGENPFTGWARLYGVPGFRPDAQVRFAQPRPGPLSIQEIVVTILS